MNTSLWTSNVSQYLMNRRVQIKQAYQHQLMTENMQVQHTEQSLCDMKALFIQFSDDLFQCIFMILGQELEQGHTVVSINIQSQCCEVSENITWQNKLLEMLLIEWEDFVENPRQSLQQLINNETDSDFDHLFVQGVLETSVKETLMQRLELAKRLCCFFLKFQQRLNPDSNGLMVFAQYLSDLPLFVNQQALTTQAFSNQQAPIVLNVSDCVAQLELSFWIHRSWQAEQSILANIHRLNGIKPMPLDLTDIAQSGLKEEQLLAIQTANNSAFCIITGGPGTGKTYTVAQMVIALHHANVKAVEMGNTPLSLVLTAPTGKASQRMQESLQSALDSANVSMDLQEAKTIHRLLGIGTAGTPRYTSDFPLSEDVIIVDEASMLGVELANNLLSAVKTGARLILLGDAHQLSAVEAGAVLSDLCQLDTLKSVHANLIQSTRFTADSAVGQLATYINSPKKSQTSASLKEIQKNDLNKVFTTFSELSFYQVSNQNIDMVDSSNLEWNDFEQNNFEQQKRLPKAEVYRQLSDGYQSYFVMTQQIQHTSQDISSEQLQALMDVFNQFRILTVGHNGDYGDDRINEILTDRHRKFLKLPLSTLDWYHGRPVMVRKNNYRLGLFNGDIGVCVTTKNGLAVYFEGKEKPIAINMLGNLEVSTAYAMTVHKSQGSEFSHVAIMVAIPTLSSASSALLSREMLYTAVTRAKQKVSIYGSLANMHLAITSPTIRRTGLGF